MGVHVAVARLVTMIAATAIFVAYQIAQKCFGFNYKRKKVPGRIVPNGVQNLFVKFVRELNGLHLVCVISWLAFG